MKLGLGFRKFSPETWILRDVTDYLFINVSFIFHNKFNLSKQNVEHVAH